MNTKQQMVYIYITGYRFVDMEILGSVFSSLRCADCACFTLALMENNLHMNVVHQNCDFFVRIVGGEMTCIHSRSRQTALK